MKTMAITGSILTLASAASYVSEVSLLAIWGGALLVIARAVRVRPATETPVVAPTRASDVRSTGAIRLQPGV